MDDPTDAEIADALRVVRAHSLDEMPFCADSLRQARGERIADHPMIQAEIERRFHELRAADLRRRLEAERRRK